MALAGDGPVTDDQKLALAERMEATKDQSRRAVENGERTGDEKVALTGVAADPRGSDVELATDAEREASAGQDAGDSG